MASFDEIWAGLKDTGVAPPFLLLDCAGFEGGASALPRDAFSEFECLFSGDLGEELADVAPYLGRIRGFDEGEASIAKDILNRQAGMLVLPRVTSDEGPSFADLHRHFRKFNVVYGPEGRPLFFRYYDPRVLVSVLSVMDAEQLDAFFRPIAAFVLAEPSCAVVQCALLDGRLSLS